MIIDMTIVICSVLGVFGGWLTGKKLGAFLYGTFFQKTKVIVTKLDGSKIEYLINAKQARALKREFRKHKL